MKHFIYIVCSLVAIANVIASCSSTETYAQKREAELNAISKFISTNHISVISKANFDAAGCVTDTSKNEYVLFNTTGVYMQIINKGTDGKPLPTGAGTTVVARFTEYCISSGDTTCTNEYMAEATIPDYFVVTNSYGTFTASFKSGMMYSWYSSTTVPGGWLVPLSYINLGRGANKWVQDEFGNYLDKDGNITTDESKRVPGSNAHVRIIVPHDQGTTTASSNVYAYYYDITYELPEGEIIQ